MEEPEPTTGLAGLLAGVKYIQTKLTDFISDNGEVIEITDRHEFVKKKKVEYLGIEVPPSVLVIDANGCLAMAKPKCPNCGSLEIRKNGTRTRNPQTITGTKIPIKIQKYQCADCNENFEPD
ncbi:MAG: transposase family protein, partial [Thermoplasmata archaeon]